MVQTRNLQGAHIGGAMGIFLLSMYLSMMGRKDAQS